MAKLTRDDVLKLARLARIDLTNEEIAEFEGEFNEILQYVEQLQAVDVEGFAPTSQVTGLINITRKDVEKNYGYTATELLKNAPSVKDGHIQVRKMIG